MLRAITRNSWSGDERNAAADGSPNKPSSSVWFGAVVVGNGVGAGVGAGVGDGVGAGVGDGVGAGVGGILISRIDTLRHSTVE